MMIKTYVIRLLFLYSLAVSLAWGTDSTVVAGAGSIPVVTTAPVREPYIIYQNNWVYSYYQGPPASFTIPTRCQWGDRPIAYCVPYATERLAHASCYILSINTIGPDNWWGVNTNVFPYIAYQGGITPGAGTGVVVNGPSGVNCGGGGFYLNCLVYCLPPGFAVN